MSISVPTDIAGCVCWLAGDHTTGVSDNDPVSTAQDGSSAGNNGTAASFDRPTYKTGILNGKAVFRFDGSANVLAFPTNGFSSMTAGSVFVVIKIANDPPGSINQSGLWQFSNGSDTHFPYTDGSIYDGWGTGARDMVVNPTPSLASWRIFGIVCAAIADRRAYLDGTQIFSSASENFVTMPSVCHLGRSASSYYLDGDIAEFIVYDSALSTGDRQDVEAYLTAKYFSAPGGVSIPVFMNQYRQRWG